MSGASALSASITTTTSTLTWANRVDHLLARWAVRREWHRVKPGLHALGNPTPDSPVFVTANYTLSFDALRTALRGRDAYILVLDTYGINVWCAAGKGTFGTGELVRRVHETGLASVVRHRRLILPQLGAPGVNAQEVRTRGGFSVEYGPIRAGDLPAYLETHQATPEMRRVRFNLLDRIVLIPVEFVHVIIWLALAWFFISPAVAAAILSGAVLFPILLPWLPTRDFSSKGLLLGLLTVLPFVVPALTGLPTATSLAPAVRALSFLLACPAITAYIALNFTGSTPFTSRTAVKREIARYIPPMAALFVAGFLISAGVTVYKLTGGA